MTWLGNILEREENRAVGFRKEEKKLNDDNVDEKLRKEKQKTKKKSNFVKERRKR